MPTLVRVEKEMRKYYRASLKGLCRAIRIEHSALRQAEVAMSVQFDLPHNGRVIALHNE